MYWNTRDKERIANSKKHNVFHGTLLADSGFICFAKWYIILYKDENKVFYAAAKWVMLYIEVRNSLLHKICCAILINLESFQKRLCQSNKKHDNDYDATMWWWSSLSTSWKSHSPCRPLLYVLVVSIYTGAKNLRCCFHTVPQPRALYNNNNSNNWNKGHNLFHTELKQKYMHKI